MHPLKSILEEFYSIPADYKAEVLAAEIESAGGIDAEIWFKAVSTFRRPSGKDVDRLEWEEGADGPDRLMFLVNREGLYDMIPQGIFHYNPSGDTRNRTSFVEEIKYQRGLEAQARKFFLPIEDEFFQQRLKLERLEREFDNRRNTGRNRELFETLFGDSSPFDDQQVLTLLYLLPLATRIRGDESLISFCMSRVLGGRVTVEKAWRMAHFDSPEDVPALEDMTLGMDSILSGGSHTMLLHYFIEVHDIPSDQYAGFLGGGYQYGILQRLISWFLPVHLPYEFRLNPEAATAAWVLGEETEAFMGYNTGI